METNPFSLSGNSWEYICPTYPPIDCPTMTGRSIPSCKSMPSSQSALSFRLKENSNGHEAACAGASHTITGYLSLKYSTCLSNNRWSAVKPGRKRRIPSFCGAPCRQDAAKQQRDSAVPRSGPAERPDALCPYINIITPFAVDGKYYF